MRVMIIAIGLLLFSVTAMASGLGSKAAATEKLQAKPGVSLLEEEATGRVRYVMGQLSASISAGLEIEATLEFLEDNRDVYGIRNAASELSVERLDLDKLGQKHVRMKQQYEGLPVFGGQLISHFDTDGVLSAVNGTYVEGIKLDPTPQINDTEALTLATTDLASFFGPGNPDDAELMVFPWEGTNYLVWHTVIWSNTPMGRWEYFVDAKTGEVVFKANRIMDTEAIGTGTSVMGTPRNHIDTDYDGAEYRMIDATRQAGNDPHGHGGQMAPGEVIRTHVADPDIPGTLVVDADNDWSGSGQASAVDGQVWAALVYDWMLDVYGRNSFDDAGSMMRTTVDYSLEGDNNAYWQGTQIVVWTSGTGWRSLAGCPDVIAHEWGHAVTDYTSDLIYQKESGALNESFSDMMGAAFEFAHDTLDTPDWEMGENGRISGGGFRDMSDPTVAGDPDTYEGSYWVSVDGCTPSNYNDQCGVHTNSGVGNKWFYLLSDGGSHNGVTVTGIGVENAILVAYRANQFYWTQSSTYSEAAYGTVSAADDLDGTGVWTQSVRDAWEAVGVDMPAPFLIFSYPTGQPSLLTPGVEATFVVDVSATFDGSVVAGSGNVIYRIDGGSLLSAPMTDLAPGSFEGTLPALACGQTLEYLIEAYEATEGQFLDPGNSSWLLAEPGTDQSLVFEDDFETNMGWTAESGWARGTPTGGGGEYGGPDPSSAYSGSNVYGYNLNGDYPSDLSERHLTSPQIDCSGLTNVHIDFYRWLGVEQPAFDHASIRVSNNGSDWITVWENSDEIADTEWTLMDVDISSVASGQSSVFVRFTMGTTDGGWEYCGWNVDDFQVTGYECTSVDDPDVDGVPSGSDNCPETYNPGQGDGDGDLVGDACDLCAGYDDALDADGDTVPDGCDICAGYDDLLDSDSDSIPDDCDNCALVNNPGQEDSNDDDTGDACCCVGRVGDANGSTEDEPTISDVSVLIDHLFISGVTLICYQESDVNQSGGNSATADDITIGDISTLVDYLFLTGPSLGLPDCL